MGVQSAKGSEFACGRWPDRGGGVGLLLITQADERRDQAMNDGGKGRRPGVRWGAEPQNTERRGRRVIIIRVEERHAMIKHVYRERKSPAIISSPTGATLFLPVIHSAFPDQQFLPSCVWADKSTHTHTAVAGVNRRHLN